MSSFLDELCSYLDTQDAAFIFDNATGRNTFCGVYPDTPSDLTALLGMVGSNITASRDVKELTFPRFQLVVRDSNYEEGSARYELARSILHGLIGVELSTIKVLRCHAEQEGGPIGQDDQGRFEFAGNFVAEYYVIPEAP